MEERDKMEYDVFIKGKLIDLVCLSEEIVEKSNWYKWFNDEEITQDTQNQCNWIFIRIKLRTIRENCN